MLSNKRFKMLINRTGLWKSDRQFDLTETERNGDQHEFQFQHDSAM